MLRLENVDSGYGKKQVISGISLEVMQGEIVALIGPNGAGKSTVLKAVCGLIPVWSGDILFEDVSIAKATPSVNFSAGLVYSPQGNRVFQELTVIENLELGDYLLPRKELEARMDEALSLFPTLRDRMKQDAGSLSGGEQQMLALARTLISKPRFLLLDEPSLGLSPNLVEFTFNKIADIAHRMGIGILIVEQKVREVLRICDRVYSMKLGRLVFKGDANELIGSSEALRRLFL